MAKKKTQQVPTGRQYDGLLSSVSELLERARHTSARAVNAVITATYWEVGRRIVEHEQSGESRAEYGTTLLKKLSVDLTARFGRGFSERNLEQMRLFYTLWPISQTLSAKSEGRGIPKTLSPESGILHTPSEVFQTLSGISQAPPSEIRTNEYDLSISRYKESEYEKPKAIMNPEEYWKVILPITSINWKHC